MDKKIIIIGAGPTGLGAAYRLQELGYTNWAIYEKNNHVGGLSASFEDKKGFTWDIGGHVLFSHYPYFDELFEKLMKDDYLEHEREAWIRLMNRFIPYPFQNNIKYLPKDKVWECLLGLLEAQGRKGESGNFKEWILDVFGEGIARYFMFPLNRKSWVYSLRMMDKDWIAERVPVVDFKKVLENIIFDRDDVSWGPNAQFKFPLSGGTGDLFKRFVPYIKNHLKLNKEVVRIDVEGKIIYFKDGGKENYDILVNTTPLNKFVLNSNLENLKKDTQELEYTSALIVGIGLKGKVPKELKTKCWMYFPEDNTPSHRVTVFSNYSPNNAPEGCWSLMAEIPYSRHKEINKKDIVNEVVEGMKRTQLIDNQDKTISHWILDAEYTYPIPTLGRDGVLKKIQEELMDRDIFSRGRFGAWRYEIGNMDHSVMQGVEIVNKLILDEPESVWKK